MQSYINLNSSNNFVRFSQRYNLGTNRHHVMTAENVAPVQADANRPTPADRVTAQSPALTGGEQPSDIDISEGASSDSPPSPHSPSNKQDGKQAHDNKPQAGGDSRTRIAGHHPPRKLYDVVIFAASGSVGRFLVEEMALVIDKHYSSPNQGGTQEQFAQQPSRRQSVPSSTKSNGIRWAVAGRSAVRLSEALCRAELSTGIRNLSSGIPVILADLNHQRSLLEMCDKASIVINCAGPYSDLGAEILIRACIECGTSYIDLSHEATFIEMISQKYSDQARRRGVFILNGCGFQSMSAEMGLNFTKQVADGRIEQVKIILSLSDTRSVSRLTSKTGGIVSEGMWNSLLTEKAQEVTVEDRLRTQLVGNLLAADGASSSNGHIDRCARPSSPTASWHHEEAQALVDTDGPGRLLKRKDTRSLVKDIIQFRNRNVSTLAWPLQFMRNFQSQQGRGYCWPVDNLTGDESQLIRGEMSNYELRRPDFESRDGWRPVRCTTFVSVRHFTHLCLLFLWVFVFELVVKFSLARYIMRKLPTLASLGHVSSWGASSRWFSGHGPLSLAASPQQQQIDRDSLNHIKYCQTFIAYGAPSDDSGDPLEDRRRNQSRSHVQLLVARVVGPEPNHVATASLAVQAALTLAMERDHLPGSGGVLTPGAAFSDTNIIYQLRRRNIKFEVLKKA